jgi:hypothetical protein
MKSHWTTGCAAVLLFASTAAAQPALAPHEAKKQNDLDTAHSVLQKATLVSVGVTGALGVLTAINKETLFWDGLCQAGKPAFGEWGCNGLNGLHGLAGIVTTGLFIAQEAVAFSMPVSPYDDPNDPTRQDAMRTLRVINISLVGVQGVAGILAAYPQIIGIPPSARPMFSRVLRTIHMGTGVSLAGTFTATAALQW